MGWITKFQTSGDVDRQQRIGNAMRVNAMMENPT
jgi:hypothetical protein